ncbi:hypothetical protein [Geodermatophilus sabuli]|uniref:Uncharacterized protein n=1 Tax=Geodermatophilus sabuli TaxID=1564158 RepID=A0A285E9E7_9ACTN|nr:hypothetical protein [Geodermatophilus sabuli]MBB3085089.1 hypothetical protein [Geodermatophilus sabuli]SNX95503.1 hypothetical protein SAMN06893097_102203 [Geodermatophilus sabuli]
MVLWPAVTLIGFLVLTALVIVMGTSSTARYEREKSAAAAARSTTRLPGRSAAAEPVGAARAA